MKFGCVDGCSECCTRREYYPAVEFGKVGVLVLPREREGLERLAASRGIGLSIVPRIGVSEGAAGPERVLAYQMMGRDANGDTCPFLDGPGGARSPHGGRACTIYPDRPLACRAYPLQGPGPADADPRCAFCTECGAPDGGLEDEAGPLAEIRGAMTTGARHVWRYATGVGEPGDAHRIREGWVLED